MLLFEVLKGVIFRDLWENIDNGMTKYDIIKVTNRILSLSLCKSI